MKRFMVITIPILTLSIFILIMLSGNFLKNTISKDDNIPQTIQSIIDNINRDNWEESDRKIKDLQVLWKKTIFRVQFSSERDEINSFSTNIARLSGAVIAKDKSSALVELKEAYMHWEELGK